MYGILLNVELFMLQIDVLQKRILWDNQSRFSYKHMAQLTVSKHWRFLDPATDCWGNGCGTIYASFL